MVPLAEGTLNIVMNIAALANSGAVMNVKVRIRLCFTRDNGIFRSWSELAVENTFYLVG